MEKVNSSQTSNKRIAKNTIMLYIRMIVMMVVSLITSRVYLSSLGETDFGIFNVVGGLVISFAFISNTLQLATQRFLNYEMGRGDDVKVQKIFSICVILYLIVSIVFLLIAETMGLWFLNQVMNIPNNRIVVANWVYQFAVIGFVFQMIRIPYNATIIAYEEMNFYAYFSIFEAVIKLVAAYVVYWVAIDKLFVVSSLTMLVYLLITFGYFWYCNRKYPITHFRWSWNKEKVKELASYSGWNMYGSGCIMVQNQGVDLIVNYFFGVAVNAALGIVGQLSNAINQLASNFQVAYNPQLVKLYAQGRKDSMNQLICQASKLSFFLLLYAVIPFFFCSDYLLYLWLGEYPNYTDGFVKIMLVYVLFDSMQAPLWLTVLATANIKKYQIITGSILLVTLPLVYFSMYLGGSPLFAWGIRVAIMFVLFVVRLLYLKKYLQFEISIFLTHSVFKCIVVLLFSIIPPLLISSLICGFVQLISVSLIGVFSISISIYMFGITKEEKKNVLNVIKLKMLRYGS